MLRIGCVNYHNTKPYLYAFNHFLKDLDIKLILEVPSVCAHMFKAKQVDMSLLPVGVLNQLEDYEILENYSLACDGKVRTVCIFSNSPIENLNLIYLDKDSRTSNALAQILAKEYWGKNMEFKLPSENYKLEDDTGILLIGDKVFENESAFKYKYDLGEIWKSHTGLPFVFAVWVVRNNVNKEYLEKISGAFKSAFEQESLWLPKIGDDKINLNSYLSKNIKFDLDEQKKESLSLFLSKLISLNNEHG